MLSQQTSCPPWKLPRSVQFILIVSAPLLRSVLCRNQDEIWLMCFPTASPLGCPPSFLVPLVLEQQEGKRSNGGRNVLDFHYRKVALHLWALQLFKVQWYRKEPSPPLGPSLPLVPFAFSLLMHLVHTLQHTHALTATTPVSSETLEPFSAEP